MQFKLTKKTRTHKRCFEIMTKSCRLLPDVVVSSYRSSTRSTQNFHTISLFFESKKGWMRRWQPKFATSIVYLQINMHPETFWILIPVSSNFAASESIRSQSTLMTSQATSASRQNKHGDGDHLHSNYFKRLPLRKYFSSYLETG